MTIEKQIIMQKIEKRDEVAIDLKGRRWAKCILCGKIDLVDNFLAYGGLGQVNKGKCRECIMKIDE